MTRREMGVALLAGPTFAMAADKDGWKDLFNGRNLDRWDGDPRFWKVENGVIIGSTDQHTTGKNTFLVYKEPFSNFHLISEVKLRNGNSGIQFRSERKEGWIVAGYQADFSDAGDRSAWGNFYEELGRGRGVMATPDEGWRRGKTLVRSGDWNEIEILACGPRIELKLNGETTVQARDDRATSGVIAIQLHSGKPMQVAIRKMRIQSLGGSC